MPGTVPLTGLHRGPLPWGVWFLSHLPHLPSHVPSRAQWPRCHTGQPIRCHDAGDCSERTRSRADQCRGPRASRGLVDTSDQIFCFYLEMCLTACPRLCLSLPVRADTSSEAMLRVNGTHREGAVFAETVSCVRVKVMTPGSQATILMKLSCKKCEKKLANI